MTDCIFCQIIKGEIPADKIYEDEKAVAFLDLRPSSRGHSLIVHKIHSQDFLGSSEDLLCELMPRIQKTARAILRTTGATGFNLTTNNGAAAGQVIFHLHFHIIPRYEHDGLKLFPQQDSEKISRQSLAEAIRKNL